MPRQHAHALGTHGVLVVEDTADIREVLLTLLEDEGFVVEVAHDGDAAIRLLETHSPPIDHL